MKEEHKLSKERFKEVSDSLGYEILSKQGVKSGDLFIAEHEDGGAVVRCANEFYVVSPDHLHKIQ